MDKFEQKPVQYPAVQFEGGLANATTIINWLMNEFRVDAYYRPERVIETPGDDEQESYTDPEAIMIVTNREIPTRILRVGNWLMPNTPEGMRRFDVYDDESIGHFFNKVG